MLAGILKPSEGHAVVMGHDVAREAEALKAALGYMPQQFGLYGDLTVDENMYFMCDVFNVTGSQRETQISELLAFTGLENFRDRRGRALSGGMQKKLSLAAALIHRPQLLLLDEPTTGVDPVARREFWDILTSLHAGGSTVVVSTPYMDEAERCNRIGLMYNGQMMICDTPAAIKRMLPGNVLALRANDLNSAVTVLAETEGVIDVQPYGDMLSVIIKPESTSEDLERTLTQAGIHILDLRTTPPRLEEAFIYFVRQFAAQEVAS